MFDASSGKQQGDWAAEGLGRVGDLLTQDPLVVTARYASGAKLVDLLGSRPITFGRDKGWFGGEVPASFRLADTVWVQYDELDRLVGYDLATHKEAGTVQVGYDSTLVGTHDGQLVVTAGGINLWLVDPSTQGAPFTLGRLPTPAGEDGSLVGSEVMGDGYLVRVWHGRAEAVGIGSTP